MEMTQLIQKLGRQDIKLIARESFLVFMLFFVFGFGAILRWGFPAADAFLANQGLMPSDAIPYRVSDLYPMFVTYMGMYTVGSLLVGTVFGFLLLDEKDFNTIKAVIVTPLPMRQYLLYRIGVPIILSFFVILFTVYFFNQALLPFWLLLPISIAASLSTALFVLFYAVFAENKVQGFAYSKFGGLAGATLLISWFIPQPWQWLFGLFPPFWIGKSYWMAYDGNGLWWLVLLVGIAYHIVMIRWLVQRFIKVAYKI